VRHAERGEQAGVIGLAFQRVLQVGDCGLGSDSSIALVPP